MDGEIITRVERHRQWTPQEKETQNLACTLSPSLLMMDRAGITGLLMAAGHSSSLRVSSPKKLWDDGRQAEIPIWAGAARVPCHLPFFGSGQTSRVRLCQVAVATRCKVRIVARVRPRSRRSACGSAAGRRLVVFRVADVRAPGGALALLADFR